MSSAPGTGSDVARRIADFCAEHPNIECFGLNLPELLTEIVEKSNPEHIDDFLSALHLDELLLARACAAGNDLAWEKFLTRYRASLYGTAYKIARDESTARELADSLYAELYGISEKGAERKSKLLYYSGRGSLEGFLRTIVAQEYVNRYRSTRRETSLDEAVEAGQQFEAAPAATDPLADTRLDQAIAEEIKALDLEDRFLLASYFLDGRKLAEIARLQRVHESTISRKLERATASLRKRIRKRLIALGMSARQADEAMHDIDVRDLAVPVEKSLRQESRGPTF
jgi:RNA polymerase sigma-70 factor, ECF subfamily